MLAQRQWIKYRDETCSEEGAISEDCGLKVNQYRQIYLNERLRECKVGFCKNDLIAKNTFA